MGNRLSERHKRKTSSASTGVTLRAVAYQGALFNQQRAQTPMKPRVVRVQYVSGEALVDPRNLKLLVRMPTRSRPKQALEVLAKYKSMAGCSVALEVIIDDDDASMQDVEVQRQLDALGCVVTSGHHISKIEAVNGGHVQDWDVLILASDDMVPVQQGYGARVLEVMAQCFPFLDGALHFNDGYTDARLCTLPVFGRRLHEQLGYVYYPEYRSFFCDNEQTEVLSALRRLAYIDEVVIEHRHVANGRAKTDALYDRNNGPWAQDEALYKKRKAITREGAPVGFDTPAVQLSICVATLPDRASLCVSLMQELHRQALRHPRAVEIVVDGRTGPTTGAKRNALNARAIGRYVAHVDDDDQVSSDYVDQVMRAITKGADCVEMRVDMIVGQAHNPGHCSIKYSDWSRQNGTYLRCPNHLNPVRRALALQAGFPDKTIGEDYDYSMRLRPLLKTEAPTTGMLYHYYPGRGRA